MHHQLSHHPSRHPYPTPSGARRSALTIPFPLQVLHVVLIHLPPSFQPIPSQA
jgi:hypothetical protein